MCVHINKWNQNLKKKSLKRSEKLTILITIEIFLFIIVCKQKKNNVEKKVKDFFLSGKSCGMKYIA